MHNRGCKQIPRRVGPGYIQNPWQHLRRHGEERPSVIRNYVKPPKVRRFSSVEQIDLLNGAIAGDTRSRNTLWSVAMGIIMAHLKRSGIHRCNYDDIIQEWAVAFFSSLADFDSSRGAAPSSFFYRRAPHTIRDYMRKYSV